MTQECSRLAGITMVAVDPGGAISPNSRMKRAASCAVRMRDRSSGGEGGTSCMIRPAGRGGIGMDWCYSSRVQ